MNTITIENRNGKTKEFRVLFEFLCEKGKKYVVFTDERMLNDGSLHTIVVTLNSKNKVMKTKPSIEDMRYIEKFLLSLSEEQYDKVI